MNVFSFVAASNPVTSFTGDAKLFLTYLVSNQGLPSSYFVNSKFFLSECLLSLERWGLTFSRSYSMWD